MLGLIGRKCGMTRVFLEDGSSVPVTAVEVYEAKVCQIKNHSSDGYNAIQVAYGKKSNRKVSKPLLGHYKAADLEPSIGLKEFSVEDITQFKLGDVVSVEALSGAKFVDVTGVSKGKGFAGTIKRHNFTMGDATHGNSLSHRAPGSIGQRQSPGRVFKGKKMAGRMGGEQVTVQNLELVKVVADKNVVLVKGAIPGAQGGLVIIKPAVKGAE
jgi:large subunit ribosomal protein L3